jgi:hypothetical protein
LTVNRTFGDGSGLDFFGDAHQFAANYFSGVDGPLHVILSRIVCVVNPLKSDDKEARDRGRTNRPFT